MLRANIAIEAAHRVKLEQRAGLKLCLTVPQQKRVHPLLQTQEFRAFDGSGRSVGKQ